MVVARGRKGETADPVTCPQGIDKFKKINTTSNKTLLMISTPLGLALAQTEPYMILLYVCLPSVQMQSGFLFFFNNCHINRLYGKLLQTIGNLTYVFVQYDDVSWSPYSSPADLGPVGCPSQYPSCPGYVRNTFIILSEDSRKNHSCENTIDFAYIRGEYCLWLFYVILQYVTNTETD